MPVITPNSSDPLRRLDGLIADDRPCRGCGYNLRGLRLGDRCPECGAAGRAVTRPRGEIGINDTPIEHLRLLRAGSLLLLLGGPLGVASFVIALQAEEISPGNDATRPAGTVASLAWLAWAAGAWLVHLPAPQTNGASGNANKAWRTVNRLLAFAPVTICGVLIAQLLLGPNIALPIAAIILLAVALAGYISLCYYASMLSVWAGDDDNAERFRISAFVTVFGGLTFGIAFLIVLGSMIVYGPGILSMPAAFVTGLLTTYCVWGGIRSLHSLHSTLCWAIRNRSDSIDAQVRTAARIHARIAENQSDASRKKARHINNP